MPIDLYYAGNGWTIVRNGLGRKFKVLAFSGLGKKGAGLWPGGCLGVSPAHCFILEMIASQKHDSVSVSVKRDVLFAVSQP